LTAWAGILQATHHSIAMLRHEPHWQLHDQDARAYGQAVANAARHLSLGVTQKALDFTALAFTIINMETPRIGASMQLRHARRSGSTPQQPPRGPAQVFEFTPRPAAPSPANPAGQPAPSTDAPAPQPGDASVEGFTGDGIDGPIGGNA
jgi:hypothetical protein